MKYKSKHILIGGMKCPCCVPFSSSSKNKKFVNREERRKEKLIRNENLKSEELQRYHEILIVE